MRDWLDVEVPYKGLQVVDENGWRQVKATSFVEGLERLERLEGRPTIYRRRDGGRVAVGRQAIHFLVEEGSEGAAGDVEELGQHVAEYWRWRDARAQMFERSRAWGAADSSWKLGMAMQEGKLSWLAAEDRRHALAMLELLEGLCPTPPPAADLEDGGRLLNLSSPGEGLEFCAWASEGPVGWPRNVHVGEHLDPCPELSKKIEHLKSGESLQDLSSATSPRQKPRQQILTGETQLYETSETGGDRWWWYPNDTAAFSELAARALDAKAEICREGRVWGFTEGGRSVGVFQQSRGPSWNAFR